MEYIEISAKTVDDALTEACLKLSTTSDKLEYEVIDKGIWNEELTHFYIKIYE